MTAAIGQKTMSSRLHNDTRRRGETPECNFHGSTPTLPVREGLVIVADTTAWIDYWNKGNTPQAKLLDLHLFTTNVFVGDLIIAEFLRGFKDNTEFLKAKKVMQAQPYRRFSGKLLAYKSAENYRRLRKKGITIRKTVDIIIGTFCIENDLALLHNDRDYDPMEEHLGLKVVR
jgi:predicted nucleic acid-binding protein